VTAPLPPMWRPFKRIRSLEKRLAAHEHVLELVLTPPAEQPERPQLTLIRGGR
jgi:hypothetical protein